ncbi:GalNAc(5)-diNAcBac-PP-undecaprenol beta-1,3-glucosyltransferase [compost metagenome]
MINQPVVSIIIPTYNRAHLIGETLDSIVAQTYNNWECIVVDDGSTDDTKDLVKDYQTKDSRISYHRRPDNYLPGGNGARNYGFDISKGEYINWFDSDDIMLPGFISEKAYNIGQNDLIISSHYVTDVNNTILETKNVILKKTILEDYLYWGDSFSIITNNIMFKRDFIDVGGFRFNENILRGQETEFLINIFTKSCETLQFKIINTPLFYYRQHVGTKSTENTNQSKRFNYSACYINFQKLTISKKYGFKNLINDSKSRLQKLSVKTVKERDHNSTLFLVKSLIRIPNFRSKILGVGVYVCFLFNKTPKIIFKQWDKI